MIWCNYKWRSGQPWGDFHPDDLKSWYDPSAISIDKNNILNLTIHNNPREFDLDNKKIIIPHGVGLIISEDSFDYGYYEAECKMPVGTSLWPAFWLTAINTWPPEIDIVEGDSKKNSSYWNGWLKWRNIAANLHYGIVDSNKKHLFLGAKSPYLFFKKPDKKFIKYSLLWSENEILIKYDNRIVTYVTDKNILKWYENKKMSVIFNVGIQDSFAKDVNMSEPFQIKNFKYNKL